MWFRKQKEPVPNPVLPKQKKKDVREGALKRDLESLRKNPSRFGMGVGNNNINAVIKNILNSARDMSRDLTMTNPVAKKYINITSDAVCGSDGIYIKPDVRKPDGSTDTLLSDYLERKFYEWADNPERFSLNGSLSIDLWQGLLEKTRARDGEVFVVLHKDKDLKVEIIDAARLPTTKNEVKANSFISSSIEYDNKTGRVIAYHVCRYNPVTEQLDQGNFDVIPSAQMIHLFTPEHANQRRGLPDLFSGTKVLNELNQYYEATLVGKRISSSTMCFVTNSNNNDFSLEDDPEVPVFYETMQAGQIVELAAGKSVSTINPQAGIDRIGEFTDNIMTLIAMSLGVSVQTLTGSTANASFSASKLSQQIQHSAMKTRSNLMISRVLKVLYRNWLALEMINNSELNLSFINFEDLLQARYILPKVGSIDPVREAQEQQMYLDMGVKSRQQVILEMGGDPNKIMNEIQLEQGSINANGIASNAGTDSTDPAG